MHCDYLSSQRAVKGAALCGGEGLSSSVATAKLDLDGRVVELVEKS